MDVPQYVMRTPMVGLVLHKYGVVLGNEHSCLFISVLRRHHLEIHNFGVVLVLCGNIHSIPGLRGVRFRAECTI